MLPSIAKVKRDIQHAERHCSECRIVDCYAECGFTQCLGGAGVIRRPPSRRQVNWSTANSSTGL